MLHYLIKPEGVLTFLVNLAIILPSGILQQAVARILMYQARGVLVTIGLSQQ